MISLGRKVTIIILTWNGLEYTKKCLESLFRNCKYENAHIMVVDNGSDDGTLDYLSSLDKVEVIKNDVNLGFVAGNNVGIEMVSEGDIILLNNDIIVTQSDWIQKLQDAVYSNKTYGIAGCRLINEKNELLHAGTYIYPETYWGQQIGGGERDINQYSSIREVEGVVFACAYIKRDVLSAIGGLNKQFFSYFEDTDYCFRAKEAGYKTICCGDVTLIHYQNVSTDINKVNFSDMFLKSQETFKGIWEDKLRSRYTKGVSWHSIINFPSGYAVSAKNMMLALDELNVDVRYKYVYGNGTPFPVEEPQYSSNYRVNIIRQRTFREDYPQIVYGQGDVFYRNNGKYKIGFTMLETTGIPKEWVRQANMMNEVWCPSTFNVETFKASGVNVPIYIVPLGIDPNYFNPHIKASHRNDDKYVFLSVFEWGERKAPEVLLKAYSKAFRKSDNVKLICKIFNNDGSINVQREIEKMNLPKDGGEIVVLYNVRIDDYQMSALYKSADCFVLSSRGEGWGMPILEAMACGLPTIATNWSSQKDFMNESNSYCLDIDGLIDAKAKCPYYEGFQWANPSEEHLSTLMRYVYEHQDEAAEKGKKAAKDALEKWTWEASAKKIKARLDEISIM